MTIMNIAEIRELTENALLASRWIGAINDAVKESAKRGEWSTEICLPTFCARFMHDAEFRSEIFASCPGYMIAGDPSGHCVYISWYDPQRSSDYWKTYQGINLLRALDRSFSFFKSEQP